MQAYKVRSHVGEDGSLTVENLPFPAGEAVEVIVLAEARKRKASFRLASAFSFSTFSLAKSDTVIIALQF